MTPLVRIASIILIAALAGAAFQRLLQRRALDHLHAENTALKERTSQLEENVEVR